MESESSASRRYGFCARCHVQLEGEARFVVRVIGQQRTGPGSTPARAWNRSSAQVSVCDPCGEFVFNQAASAIERALREE